MKSESLVMRWIWDRITAHPTSVLLSLIAIFAFFLRCLHLFNPNSYYILSADSHFFHWLAGRVMAGEGPPLDAPSGGLYTLHTGLTYPVAYIAKAVSYVFNLSSSNALDLTSKLLPPFLGVVSLLIVYFIVSRLSNRLVALFSALAWALMLQLVFIEGAGYIDRDGFSVLLVMLGAFVFYLSREWHLHIGRMDIGWLAAGLVVLGLEGLLYLEWVFVGPVLLLVVLIACFLAKLLLGYIDHVQTEPSAIRRLADAFRESNWRTFIIIIGANVIAAALNPASGSWFKFVTDLVGAGGKSGVAEMGGITLGDLSIYHLFVIPIVMGIYIAWKYRNRAAIFFSSWLVVILILSIFSKRVMFFVTPAACALSGIGLAYLWGWRKEKEQSRTARNAGVIAFLCLLVLISVGIVPSSVSNPAIAVNKDWQGALTYLREETPEDSKIMTSWGWGYWILDLGQRRPVVDNGYYYYNDEKLRDVALAYLATDPNEAVKVMEKYDADYLIFSKLDLDSAETIIGWTGLDVKADEFPEDSLIARTLSEEFEFGGGLEVVYRSVPQGEVVILGLTN